MGRGLLCNVLISRISSDNEYQGVSMAPDFAGALERCRTDALPTCIDLSK